MLNIELSVCLFFKILIIAFRTQPTRLCANLVSSYIVLVVLPYSKNTNIFNTFLRKMDKQHKMLELQK